MKGVLFTELIEMMEDLMGLEFTNRVIENAHLKNKGAYTTIGFYQYQDMLKLMESLNKQVNSPQDILLKSYGEYFFYRKTQRHSGEIKKYKDAFSLLKEAPQILDREIRKLEPNALIPEIKTKKINKNTMQLYYHSEEKMSYLMEGLIKGCIGYFEEPITLKRENLNAEETRVRFVLQKESGNERY